MSNAAHSSDLRRSLDKTKDRLAENASLSEKKKQHGRRRPNFDKYKKSTLDLVPNGCSGCCNESCRYYVTGLEKRQLKGGQYYGCHSKTTK